MICNKQYKRVTSSHLKSHGYTTQEYLYEFPTAILFSDELRHAYGKKARENNPMHDAKTVEKVRQKITGVPKSDSHKAKLSESRIGVSWGKHTDEHKERMSVISKENMLSRIEAGWKPPEWTDERRLQQSKRMLGNKRHANSPHNKDMKLSLTDKQRENRSEKRRAWMRDNRNSIRTSSIENSYIEWCLSNDITFIHQYPIDTNKGTWIFDFFLPQLNLLVELDGEYWHCTRQQLNRDRIKNKIAGDNGYTLLRLSDLDLNFSLSFADKEIIDSHSEGVIISRQNKLGGNGIP
jgi:very-short-patch-repair endonuclease